MSRNRFYKKLFKVVGFTYLLLILQMVQVLGQCEPAKDLKALQDLVAGGWVVDGTWTENNNTTNWTGVTFENGCVTKLEVGEKNLGPSIPNAIGDFTVIKTLNIKENGFTGTINKNIYRLTSLETLLMQQNKFTGTIDDGAETNNKLSNLKNLEVLGLDNIQGQNQTDPSLADPDFVLEAPAPLVTGMDNLQFYFVRNHEYFDVPDFPNKAGLVSIGVSGNNHTFEDIIEFVDGSKYSSLQKFFFHPMKDFSVPQNTYNENENDVVTINLGIDGGLENTNTPNTYDWYKSTDGGNTFSFFRTTNKINSLTFDPIVVGDAGIYFCEVRNQEFDRVTGAKFLEFEGDNTPENELLSIRSENITVTVNQVANGCRTRDNNALAEIATVQGWDASLFIENQTVFRNDDGCIIKIDLTDKNIAGDFPAAFAKLLNLQELYLGTNIITGTFPANFTDLTELSVLHIYENNLGGELKDHEIIFSLENIRDLQIYRNGIGGTIPPSIGNPANTLTSLSIGSNDLTGELPAEIYKLKKLRRFHITENELSGSISEEMAGFTSLEHFWISDNNFSGPLPAALGNIAIQQDGLRFQFEKNAFTFGDIIPLFSYGNLESFTQITYAPQKGFDTSTPFTGTEGEKLDVTLDFRDGPNNTYPNLYSWYKDGANTPAYEISNNKVLTLDPLQLEDAGNYTVIVTNPAFEERMATIQSTIKTPSDNGILEITSNNDLEINVNRAQVLCERDRNALIAIYDALGGDDWTNRTGWKTAPDLKDWFGVTTNGEGCVIGLDLENNNLVGTQIPDAIGDLLDLESLRFSINQIRGNIPAVIGQNLTKLVNLYLDENSLTGTIPANIGNLANLQFLHVNQNQLSGNIPVALGGLNLLRNFSLWSNNLTGEIPTELGGLTNCRYFAVGQNDLSGNVPDIFGDKTSLDQLFLNNNPQLTGPLPLGFTQLSPQTFTIFHFFDTDLCIPNNDTFQAWLASINDVNGTEVICKSAPTDITLDNTVINSDAIGGSLVGNLATIDADLPNDSHIYTLTDNCVPDAANNALFAINGNQLLLANGVVLPVNVPSLTVCITSTDASEESFSKSFTITINVLEDDCVARDRAALTAIYNAMGGGAWNERNNWLDDTVPLNEWDRVVTNDLGCVTELNLAGNNLVSEIPAEVGNLLELEYLDFGGNAISGIIPNEVTQLSKLLTFGVAANQLTGTLPANFNNLSVLQRLWIDDNNLSGTFPAVLFSMTSLTEIFMQTNQYNGTIINGFTNLTNLVSLNLGNNGFTGELPATIGNLGNLTLLGLYNNNFTGTVPDSYTNLTNLDVFSIQGNELEGLIPEGIAGNNDFSEVMIEENKFTFQDVLPFIAVPIEVYSYAPQDSVGVQNTVTIQEGDLFTFDLGIDPNITTNTYVWYKDGNPIDETKTNLFSIGEVAEDDAGEYTCEVTNTDAPNLTLYSRKTILIVRPKTDLPPPVLSAELDPTNPAERILLTWTYPAGFTPTNYTIERSVGDSLNFAVLAENQTGLSFTDGSGLTPGETYYYRVSALVDNETSPYSNIAFVTTNSLPTVADIDKIGLINTSIPFALVDFTDAYEDVDGDELDRIQILSLPQDGQLLLDNIVVNLNDEILRNEIVNLVFAPNQDFVGTTSFAYNASDGFNYAQTSANVNITINRADLPPPVLSAELDPTNPAERILLTWTYPAEFTPTNYTIERSVGDSLNFTVLAESQTGLSFTDGSGLTPGETYYYRVSALVDNETSPYSNIAFVTTNSAPTVADIDKIGSINTSIPFALVDFTDAYEDVDGDELDRIQILSLPQDGQLLLNNVGVNLNDEILRNEIVNLVFSPGQDFVGTTSYVYNASDGFNYAQRSANVNISIDEVEDVDLQVNNIGTNATEVQSGGNISISGTLTVEGGPTNNDAVFVLLLSQDTIPDQNDVVLSSSIVPAQSSRTSQDINTEVTLPDELTPGEYFIIYFVDASQNVLENNEFNNIEYIKITIGDEPPAITIMNMITANRDGFNDNLFIKNIENYPDNEVILLDRWGNEIFRKSGYQNDWEPVVGQSILDFGAYVCIVKIGEPQLVFKRMVSIMRGNSQ